VLTREPGKEVSLRDDRRLVFDDVGDPSGRIVIHLHGIPDSRWCRHPDDGIAERLGTRHAAIGHAKCPLADAEVVRTTMGGTGGRAFKPSPAHGDHCGTGVSGPAAPAQWCRWCAKSGLGGPIGRSSGARVTAFKPGATAADRSRRRRALQRLPRRVVDRLAGRTTRCQPDDDHQPPRSPLRRTPEVRPQDDGPICPAGSEKLRGGRVPQGGRCPVRRRREDRRQGVRRCRHQDQTETRVVRPSLMRLA